MKIEKLKNGLEYITFALAIVMIAAGGWFFFYGSPFKAFFLMMCSNIMLTLVILTGHEV